MVDAAIDTAVGVDQATGPAPVDAAADQATTISDALPDLGVVKGVRCGGGSYPLLGCQAPTGSCCQSVDDAGGLAYDCRDSPTACDGGYAIACATDNDCNGTEVCCHYASGTKCVGENSCSSATSGSLVCDPNGAADQCLHRLDLQRRGSSTDPCRRRTTSAPDAG